MITDTAPPNSFGPDDAALVAFIIVLILIYLT